MTFWSGETLAQNLPSLIEPFDSSRIDCAAYTLRVGRELYISPSDAKDVKSTTRRELKEKEAFVIPPGQFAFLLTEERIKIPGTALGLISMKARIKFRGLVNVSGFHVDPGYHGHLVFSVFNAGPTAVHLARGEDCFLLWYASLDAETNKLRVGKSLDGIPSELINPISGQVQSLSVLASRLEVVEKEHGVLKTIVGVAVTVALGLFAKSCAAPVTSSPERALIPRAESLYVKAPQTTSGAQPPFAGGGTTSPVGGLGKDTSQR